MTLVPSYIPRGCYKEIRKYQKCTAEGGSEDKCFNDKISVMEVCPDHTLEALRERKKWYLRAELIDNETYKRAMKVGEYNRDRSVNDLKIKTWDYGKVENMRTDSVWQDDRYSPKAYSHPHRYDSVNFPDMEYKDIFGGNFGEGARKEQEYYKINLLSGRSKAMVEHAEKQRHNGALKKAMAEVKEHNAQE